MNHASFLAYKNYCVTKYLRPKQISDHVIRNSNDNLEYIYSSDKNMLRHKWKCPFGSHVIAYCIKLG